MPQFPPDLREILAGARRVSVLTGSGVSAESGVPTFREAQTGLWARYHPEDLATPAAFERNPGLVWEWYAWRQDMIRQAQPNPAHLALVEMERHYPSFTLITQNVDGLHERAGSQNILELHGNILRARCVQEGTIVASWQNAVGGLPQCPHCGGLLRPDVVWFGEALPQETLDLAWHVAQNCDLFFSIGTSSVVHPAASLPYLALQNQIPVVEINPHETPLTRQADYQLPGPAGVVLPALVKEVWG